jgi:anti-sigma factor RsiW
MDATKLDCRSEEIAAYLDGELDSADRSLFESHIDQCAVCSKELREQRRFLCELDFALNEEPAPELPVNFVEVVAVNAQSDMRGVRSTIERGRALRLCILLSLASMAVMGAAARDTVTAVVKPVLIVCSFAFHAMYNAGAGATIISRSVGGHLLLDSSISGFAALFLLIASIALLPRLISRYHRAQN